MKITKTLAEVQAGEIFEVAGIEFIKFFGENGHTAAVTKSSLFNSRFGEDNNLAKSKVQKKLEKEFLPKIEAAVGAKNIVQFETDLTSLDGSEKHGKMKSKISLPTFDFYRKHVKIFDKHKCDGWWWLATPDTTSDHYNDNWVVCVSPRGVIGDDDYDVDNGGVRPFLFFVSSISVSCEE